MTWPWPLFEGPRVWPDEPGRFGAVRKHDIHTGVDLYTYSGMPVITVESGTVVAIEDYTGPKAGSPWWNDTQAVLIEGPSGVICYGELGVLRGIKVGDVLAATTCLGSIKPVLKEDKGRPQSMLHFELYAPGTRESVVWELDQPKPENLLDPTAKLRKAWEAAGGVKVEYPGKGPL